MNVNLEEIVAGQRAQMEEMAKKYANQIKETGLKNVEKVNAMKEAMDVEIVQINDTKRALKEELEKRSKCIEATMRQVRGELLKNDETIDELQRRERLPGSVKLLRLK